MSQIRTAAFVALSVIPLSLVLCAGCSHSGGQRVSGTGSEELLSLEARGFQASGSVMVASLMPTEQIPLELASAASAVLPVSKNSLQSGTISLNGVISRAPIETDKNQLFAPLFAFVPPSANFIPAANETWLEVDRSQKSLRLHTGEEVSLEIRGEGTVEVAPGNYSLQHKQRAPLWYAPDSYFTKRQLAIPPAGDRLRYLRGALGEFAMFPSPDFPIHSGPLWTDEVGGVRLSRNDLLSIFSRLTVGSTVVIR